MAYLLLTTLMIVTCACGIVLSVRQIRRSNNRSILAWQTLIYVGASNFIVLALPFLEYPDDFLVDYNDAAAGAMYFGVVMINIVCIMYLLLMDGVYMKDTAHAGNEKRAGEMMRPLSLRLLVALGVISFGLVLLFRMPTTQNTIGNLVEIVTSRDYLLYYRVRVENIFLFFETDILTAYFTFIALSIVLPLVNLISLYTWLAQRRTIWLVYWGATLAVLAAVAVIALQKAPILIVFLTNIILLLLVKFEQRGLELKSALKLGLWCLAPFCVFVFLLFRALGFEDNVIIAVAERFIHIPLFANYAAFAVFPELHPHTHFGTSRTLNMLLGLGQKPDYFSQYKTIPLITGEFATGRPFNLNMSILGDGWAEMGYIGIIESAVLLFGVFFLWDVYLRRRRRHVPLTPLLALYLGNFFVILSVGLVGCLVGYGMLVSPLVYLLLLDKRCATRLGHREGMKGR